MKTNTDMVYQTLTKDWKRSAFFWLQVTATLSSPEPHCDCLNFRCKASSIRSISSDSKKHQLQCINNNNNNVIIFLHFTMAFANLTSAIFLSRIQENHGNYLAKYSTAVVTEVHTYSTIEENINHYQERYINFWKEKIREVY